MAVPEEHRRRARATWAAGDWDSFSRLIEQVGALVLERVGIEPGFDLLDVGTGTGTGGNVREYADDLGPFVMARDMLEPQGRWEVFLGAFADLVRRFNTAGDGTARIESEYFVISVGP